MNGVEIATERLRLRMQEKMETVADFIFLDSKSLWMVTAAMVLKNACSLEEKL